MIFFLLLLGLVLVAQIAELFIPALPWLYNSHVYVVQVIVFYGAMAFSPHAGFGILRRGVT